MPNTDLLPTSDALDTARRDWDELGARLTRAAGRLADLRDETVGAALQRLDLKRTAVLTVHDQWARAGFDPAVSSMADLRDWVQARYERAELGGPERDGLALALDYLR